MTYTLILMRHAKSSWDIPGLPDHDRPLNKRGIKSAHAMGCWLRSGKWCPDQSVSSSSRRTRETYQGLAMNGPVNFTDALYHASSDRMRDVLRTAKGRNVLMLGHNPGIAELAERLVSTAPDHPRFFAYPTCATLVAKFDIPGWNDLHWGTGKVVDFAIPREVMT